MLVLKPYVFLEGPKFPKTEAFIKVFKIPPFYDILCLQEAGCDTSPLIWTGIYIYNIYIYIERERFLKKMQCMQTRKGGYRGSVFEKWNIGVNKAQPPGDGGHLWSQFCGWNAAEALCVGTNPRAKFCDTTSNQAYLRCLPRGLIRIVSQLRW